MAPAQALQGESNSVQDKPLGRRMVSERAGLFSTRFLTA